MPGIFLHVGLHKTATTYFQEAVWPRWSAVHYAGNKKNTPKESLDSIISRSKEKCVIRSSESMSGSLKRSYLKGGDWLGESFLSLDKLRSSFPAGSVSGVIVSLRRHDHWALSIYKHYLKYGGVDKPEEFFGIGGCSDATMPLKHLLVMPRLKKIEEALGVRPFCFFIEEVVSRPDKLSKEIASYLDTDVPPVFPDEFYNEGMNNLQASVCRVVNRLFLNKGCEGNGHIENNGYTGYLFAQRLKRIGSLGINAPLRLSDTVLGEINNECRKDLKMILEYISVTRGFTHEIRDSIDSTGFLN